MKESYNIHVSITESKLSEDEKINFEKRRLDTDLKELENVNRNIDINSIKALGIVNKSHKNLLAEVKNKSSKINLKAVEEKDIASTSHTEDTMNLFE